MTLKDNNPSLESPLPAIKQGVEAIQMQHKGQPMVLLRDQEGINETPVAISMAGFLVATMLDGEKTASQIQSQVTKVTGQLIGVEEIMSLVSQLDKAQYLETETLHTKRKKIWDDFLKNPVRKAFHQGGGYPKDSLELAAFLGSFFQHPKGPGKQLTSQPHKPCPVGLVAPHIDFHRGGPSYAWAYQALAECEAPDMVVALGVAHMSPPSPWVFTKKEYETPYGSMKVDNDTWEKFKKVLWYDPVADEWTHRTEHSLEFQALWLRYVWRDKTPSWVPILCSSFDRFCPDRPPSTVPSIDEAIEKMGEVLLKEKEKGKKILILAGIDLAHVGPRFGDEIELNKELEQKIETEDQLSLKHAMNLKADEFYLSVVADDHWRKVCGLSALYTSLRLIKILSNKKSIGTQLTYGQAPDPAGGIVSFTSLIFPNS
jgi:AmmeMemoRadiSam system protein B